MLYKNLVRPVLFRQNPEKIHDWTLKWLKRVGNTPLIPHLIRTLCSVNTKYLGQKLFDLWFPNPIGLAAGMDKKGDSRHGFQMLGFGFLEIGGVTFHPQEGNPKPRVFRLPNDEAIINRMGLNGPGAPRIAQTLGVGQKLKVPLGVNIAKSTCVDSANLEAVVADYCSTLERMYPVGNFFTVNASCPNTPGLAGLQQRNPLRSLLTALDNKRRGLPHRQFQRPKALLLKVSPDLTLEELDAAVDAVRDCEFDGVVIGNTTTKRDKLATTDPVAQETGGLSGRPLRKRALEMVRHVHKRTRHLPIIGVGGISSAEDAWNMLQAGASLVQICTGLVYEGPLLVRRINYGLERTLNRCRYGSIEALNQQVYRS